MARAIKNQDVKSVKAAMEADVLAASEAGYPVADGKYGRNVDGYYPPENIELNWDGAKPRLEKFEWNDRKWSEYVITMTDGKSSYDIKVANLMGKRNIGAYESSATISYRIGKKVSSFTPFCKMPSSLYLPAERNVCDFVADLITGQALIPTISFCGVVARVATNSSNKPYFDKVWVWGE